MQHSRIMTSGPAVIDDPRSATIQRRIDVDLFVVSLNRQASRQSRRPAECPSRGT